MQSRPSTRGALVALRSSTSDNLARTTFLSDAPTYAGAFTLLGLARFQVFGATSAIIGRSSVSSGNGTGVVLRRSNADAGRLALTRGDGVGSSFQAVTLDGAVVASEWRWYAAVVKGTSGWLAASSLADGARGRISVRSLTAGTVGNGLTAENAMPFLTHSYNDDAGAPAANSGASDLALVMALPFACDWRLLGDVMANPELYMRHAIVWAQFPASGTHVENRGYGNAGHGVISGTFARTVGPVPPRVYGR